MPSLISRLPPSIQRQCTAANVRWLARLLLLTSIVVLAFSFTLDPYTNEAEFQQRHAAMTAEDTKQFYVMRAEMLTAKYSLQDYGLSALFLAAALAFLSRGKPLTAPGTMSAYAVLTVVSAATLTGAFILDLAQRAARGEFPHWVDATGVPQMAGPVLFLGAFCWLALHLSLLIGVPRNAVPLTLAFTKKADYWLMAISIVTTLMIVGLLLGGVYWYALPLSLYLYIYLSLTATRRAAELT